ncbi:MAG: hypothetical protein B7X06_02510 [Verrucomicrobia bacterium 21-51-4]|nr:MAG: hypothetical protein B7X06_02510 [Verrucomicrobia bacterium 21-51-4]HQU09254.1 hypothetical protein [Opitutales bacterium]
MSVTSPLEFFLSEDNTLRAIGRVDVCTSLPELRGFWDLRAAFSAARAILRWASLPGCCEGGLLVPDEEVAVLGARWAIFVSMAKGIGVTPAVLITI